MLASAVRLRGALAEQDRVLSDPANRGLPVGQVLEKLAISQQVGVSESARFDRALNAYREVVDRSGCTPLSPGLGPLQSFRRVTGQLSEIRRSATTPLPRRQGG